MFKYALICLLLSAPLNAVALQDPTRPLGYKVAHKASTTIALSSILISGERKLAVINGQLLKEQQRLAGSDDIRVSRIEPGRVWLSQGERRWALSLNQTRVRH